MALPERKPKTPALDSIDDKPLREQLTLWTRSLTWFKDGAMREHCLMRQAQVKKRIAEEIDYYETITEDASLNK